MWLSGESNVLLDETEPKSIQTGSQPPKENCFLPGRLSGQVLDNHMKTDLIRRVLLLTALSFSLLPAVGAEETAKSAIRHSYLVLGSNTAIIDEERMMGILRRIADACCNRVCREVCLWRFIVGWDTPGNTYMSAWY